MNEIGEMLKSTRETNGVSIEEASVDLKIKPAILENIESGNIGCFKDIFVLKDYIHEYSKYLGINPEKMIDEFNEYLFEYTSKIPINEIEKKMAEKQKQEATGEIRISSPYTQATKKYKSKTYVFLYALVVILVALVIFWSVKQITIGNNISTEINFIR